QAPSLFPESGKAFGQSKWPRAHDGKTGFAAGLFLPFCVRSLIAFFTTSGRTRPGNAIPFAPAVRKPLIVPEMSPTVSMSPAPGRSHCRDPAEGSRCAPRLPLFFGRTGAQIEWFEPPDIVSLARQIASQADLQQTFDPWVPVIVADDVCIRGKSISVLL